MFSAPAQERIFYLPEYRRDDARRRGVSLASVALVYGIGLAALASRPPDAFPPPPQEIPVEVVVEPPPEPPPEVKKTEAPKPPKDSQAPAYDAPKEGTAATNDGDNKVDAKPPPAQQTAERARGGDTSAPSPPPGAATPSDAPPAPPVPALKAAVDGEVPLAPSTMPSSDVAGGPSVLRAPASKFKMQQFSALPNVQFGGAPMKAPIAGGEGPADYLNIVVGMVRSHVRKPRGPQLPGGSPFGVIVFTLDTDGRILTSWFVQHSGSADFDKAEMEALEAAAPFPKPPYLDRAIEYHFTID